MNRSRSELGLGRRVALAAEKEYAQNHETKKARKIMDGEFKIDFAQHLPNKDLIQKCALMGP